MEHDLINTIVIGIVLLMFGAGLFQIFGLKVNSP